MFNIAMCSIKKSVGGIGQIKGGFGYLLFLENLL